MNDPSRRWFVAQAGAREHYAAARSFQRMGQLGRLYTASWCRRGARWLRRGPMVLRAMAGRRHHEVPDHKVVSFNFAAARWHLHRRLIARPQTVEQVYRWEIENSEWFGRRVASALARETLGQTDCFFGFQSECLEALRRAADWGLTTMLDLAGPGQVEDRLVQRESQRWPGWAGIEPAVPQFYYDRVRQEWQAATIVLVNSDWSRRAWIEQGVPERKIVVVPLAYEPSGSTPPRPLHGGSLTVLWLGSVILRKGIQYLIEAAGRLADSNIRFVIAGPIGISDSAVKSAPPRMEFRGRVTRDQAADLYRQADVFVIPTVSDGFAITQIEAMAHGVPVIATPNCGQVVDHEVDGLIVPVGDADALAAALARLDQDRMLLASMSVAAVDKSRTFSIKRYGELINQAIDRVQS